MKACVRGFALIELMISMVLGLILLGALLSIFSQNSRLYKQSDNVQAMEDNARFGLEQLARDLQMAGYWGGLYNARVIIPNSGYLTTSANAHAPNPDCGAAQANTIPWSFTFTQRVEFRNHGASGTINSQFPCLLDANIQSHTDIVAIRRVAGQSSADMSSTMTSVKLLSSTFYLQTNATAGLNTNTQQGQVILTGNLGSSGSYTPQSSDQPNTPPMSFYQYYTRVYYIRNYSQTAGDGVPTLCRQTLQGSGASGGGAGMVEECLADGIQDLQILWGIDTNSDNVVDTYTTQPTMAQLQQAMTARISLLARALQIDSAFTDTKVFTLGDSADTVTDGPYNDHYHRKLFETTVELRNPVIQ